VDKRIVPQPGSVKLSSPLSCGVEAGGAVYLSGQTPISYDTGEVLKGDVTVQAERTFDNIGKILAGIGLTFENVVRVTVYLTAQADFEAMNQVYRRYFKEPYPARSTLIVAGLANPAYRIEIDIIAVR